MTDTTETLNQLTLHIKSLAGASTADLIGIAPGDAFSPDESGELGAQFGPIRSLIVLAQHIVDPVQLVRFFAGGTYRDSRVASSFCDALLRDACWRVAGILREAGYHAALPRNQRYGADDPRHNISYRKAGILAGFGAFGKSQLLIHPQWGPWIRLRAVVTDARLPPDVPIDFSPCDGCSLCITACPTGALTEAGFDRAACEDFRSPDDLSRCGAVPISPLGRFNCGECVWACPIGPAPPRLTLGGNNQL